jgi:hypothetical protein
MSGESGYFISQSFGLDGGNVRQDSLVQMEIVGHFGIIVFDQASSGSFDGLSSYSSLKAC